MKGASRVDGTSPTRLPGTPGLSVGKRTPRAPRVSPRDRGDGGTQEVLGALRSVDDVEGRRRPVASRAARSAFQLRSVVVALGGNAGEQLPHLGLAVPAVAP